MNGLNGSMDGTSIHDLHKKEKMGQYEDIRMMQGMQNGMYGAMQNYQYEQGHNAHHNVQQAQHAPYYNIDLPGTIGVDYPQYTTNKECCGMKSVPMANQYPEAILEDIPDMENLARDISDNMPEDTYMSKSSEVEEEDKTTRERKGILNIGKRIPERMQEPLLIIIIFMILSQPRVRMMIGKYIPQINPDRTGQVQLIGIVIYAIIFAVLFGVIKKIVM